VGLIAVGIWAGAFTTPAWSDRDLGELETRVKAAELVLANRPGNRPPIGVPRSGNAFDYYDRVASTIDRIATENSSAIKTLYCQIAVKEATRLTLHDLLNGLSGTEVEAILADEGELSLSSLLVGALSIVLPTAQDSPGWDSEQWKKFLPVKQWVADTFRPVTDLVEAGAACVVAKRDTSRDMPALLLGLETACRPELPGPVFWEIVQSAVTAAVMQEEPERVLRLLATTLQYGRDCLDDPAPRVSQYGSWTISWMSGANLTWPDLDYGTTPTNPLHRRLAAMMGRLDEKKARIFEKYLTGLARSLPSPGYWIKYGLTYFGRAVLDHRSQSPLPRSRLLRLMMTELMRRSSRYGTGALSRSVDSFRDVERDTDSQFDTKDTLFAVFWRESIGLEPFRLETLLDLRITLNSFLLASRRDRPIADPYGDVLHTEERQEMTFIWSNGDDGKNDGGDSVKDRVMFR